MWLSGVKKQFWKIGPRGFHEANTVDPFGPNCRFRAYTYVRFYSLPAIITFKACNEMAYIVFSLDGFKNYTSSKKKYRICSLFLDWCEFGWIDTITSPRRIMPEASNGAILKRDHFQTCSQAFFRNLVDKCNKTLDSFI